MTDNIKVELPCRDCGQVVEHQVNQKHRWAQPEAHVAGGRVCGKAIKLTPEQYDKIVEGLS